VVGIFNGSVAAGNSLLVANTPKRRLGSSLAVTQSGYLVGRTLGPAVAALVAGIISQTHWMFWISGGLMVLAGILVIVFVHEVKQVVSGSWRPSWIGDLKALLAVPRMSTLMLLCFIFSMLWAGNVTIMSILMIKLFAAHPAQFGNEAFWVSAAAMGLAVSSLVALPFWGRVLNRADPSKIMVYTTAAAILTHLPLLVVQTPLQLVLCRVAFGLSATAMQPALTCLLKDYAPEGMDARAISYGTSFQFIASGMAPFLAGVIGPSLGLRTYIAMTIGLTLLGLVLWIRSDKHR
jgi:DHA1 family multidrug resistance protein-like MFS transporter